MSEAATGSSRTIERVRCRRFGLFDAMILLAGLALTLSMGAHLLVLMAGEFRQLCRRAVDYQPQLLANWPRFWHATHDQPDSHKPDETPS